MRARRAGMTDTLLAARLELARLESGDFGDPRAHLQHDEHPVPPQTTRYGLIVEVWSAVSVSLMLLLIVGLIWFHLVPWFGALVIGVVGYVIIEASFRRRLTMLMLRTSLFLAVVAAAILLWEFRLETVLVGIVAVAVLIFADNIREVIRR